MSILAAILLFSFLIFIHELGHFIAAKLSGVQVNEFSMFMGPAILKKQKGETLYSLRCIPIGGYCAMEGEDGTSDNPRAFGKASWWKRLIILVAGSGMNLIAGMLIFLAVYSTAVQFVSPVVSHVEEGSSLAVENGIQAGDRILSVDGERIYIQSDFSMILSLNPGDIHDLVVERNGEKVYLNNLSMEKRLFDNGDGTSSMRYGFGFSIEEATFASKLRYALYTSIDSVRNVRLSIQLFLTGNAGFQELTGPVGIVQKISDVAAEARDPMSAFLNVLYFGAFIAINLGIMNLLPLPALDGGRVVCLLLTVMVEKITGKRLDPKYEGYLHAAGMILLLGLMAIVMFKDIFVIIKG